MSKVAARQALTAEVAEEPFSGTLLPLALNDGKVLLGTGLRTKRVAMVEARIYALGFYGMPEDFVELESADCSPLGDDFLGSLMKSQAEKVFALTMLRTVTGKQIRDGLTEALCNIGGVPREDVNLLTQYFPDSLERGTELQLVVRPELSDVGFSLGSGLEVVRSENLCRGLHEIYFGPRAVVRGLGDSLQRQRLLLAERGILGDSNMDNDPDSPEKFSPRRGALPSMSEHETVNFPQDMPSLPGTDDAKIPIAQSTGTEIQSFTSEVSTVQSDITVDSDMVSSSFRSSSSWKEASGRARGKDGYKFGDITRTLIQKKRSRTRSDISSDADPEQVWPAALVAEGEDASWVVVGDNAKLDAASLARQNLKGQFLKYHGSALRGRLVPQWSLRHYELQAGTLQYRRRPGGKVAGADSLDGARVVSEAPKLSRAGSHYVFRVIKGSDVICRLSSPNQQLAEEWVLAIVGACAYFQKLRVPGEEPRLQLVAQAMQDSPEPQDDEEEVSTTPAPDTIEITRDTEIGPLLEQEVPPPGDAKVEPREEAVSVQALDQQEAKIKPPAASVNGAVALARQGTAGRPDWLSSLSSVLCAIAASVGPRLQLLRPYLQRLEPHLQQLREKVSPHFRQLAPYFEQLREQLGPRLRQLEPDLLKYGPALTALLMLLLLGRRIQRRSLAAR